MPRATKRSTTRFVPKRNKNTHLKDDDREFAALKIFVEDAKNDLNSQNITSKDITTIEAKLAEMLKKFFNNNFFRSSMQINENDID